MRFFNTEGPVKCEKHYCLPPFERLNIDEILHLIDREKYFVLHAPRQTGKTSCLLGLMDYLNARDKYRCLYVNVEAAQAAREKVYEGIQAVLSEIGSMAEDFLDDDFPASTGMEILEKKGANNALNILLTKWCKHSKKPIVLLIDEIDSLVGDTLISVLRQIRAGYNKRPALFPQSIILCGVRDVRDYRIHSDRQKAIITGGSAFNIKAESLRLGNFSKDEVEILYKQHTDETGQKFEKGCVDLVMELTGGQPWLVNALGYEACFDMKKARDRKKIITASIIEEAKENIILRRDTHLDQLADKLKEGRVRRVIGPVLEGTNMEHISHDDIQYTLDLGLITRTASGLEISNAIYREIIPRELTMITLYNLEPLYKPAWFVLPDGSLNMEKLMVNFQEFFRENSEIWVERFDYKEAGPQLLLQAFLQRIVNSGGRIDREYGLGRRRTDIFVRWPLDKDKGFYGPVQKIVIELKILYKTLEKTLEEGLRQTAKYMDKCGADQGHLVIFDRRPGKSWDEKIFRKQEEFNAKKIIVWGM